MDVADRVAGWARTGEDIEVYVARGDETDIRAYDGEVESLTSATSAGIGIRVVVEHRLGFAWAGSLDRSVLEETLAEARDNASFATPDEHVALAVPDGVAAVPVDLWDDGLASVPTTKKVELALALEAQARTADPRIRQVDHADYGDGSLEVALVSTTGIRSSSRKTSGYVSVGVIAGEGDGSQTGNGYSVGRGFDDARSRQGGRRSGEAGGADAWGHQGTVGATDGGVRSPGGLDGALGGLRRLVGGGGGQGPVVLCRQDRLSWWQTRCSPWSTTPPTRGPTGPPPTMPRVWPAGATSSSTRVSCRGFLYDTVSASRAGVSSTGSAVRGGFAGTPGPGCRALVLAPGAEGYDEDGVLAAVGDGLFVQSMTGVHSGVNPISGDFSVGAEGLMIRNGKLAEPVREITVASTLQRMLQSLEVVGADVEWLPGYRRRSDPGRR